MLLIIVFNIRVGFSLKAPRLLGERKSLAYNGWYTSARCDGKG